MFNFHKPRTYRSTEGCCICRAKSSSSRFTDSRKYERDIMPCFDLKYPRQGEICNACVLLVKRFKRLPVGSKRNWSHVVDARLGPGGSKIQTKYKSERISSRSSGSPSSSLVNNSGSGSASTSSSSAINGGGMSSYIPEKFSKIFKKSKKLKENSTFLPSVGSSYPSSSATSMSLAKQRKSSNNGWSQNTTSLSLPTTPDSLDSDYEEARSTHHGSFASSGAAGTVVQFQTQTRASAFRAQAAAEARRRVLKLGSKRRKCLPPRKNRVTVREEDITFFDEEEWREQKSCCGILYECPALGGALIVDVANYKPCEKHQPTTTASTSAQQSTTMTLTANDAGKEHPISMVMPPQRAIIQTMPAVVQLQPPASAAYALTVYPVPGSSNPAPSPSPSSSSSSSLTDTKTSTPVLKKHHLFFQRQRQRFPQGDMVTESEGEVEDEDESEISYNTTPSSKTESDYNNQTEEHQTYTTQTAQQQIQNDHAISAPQPQSSATLGVANNFSISSSAALTISVTSVAASPSTPAVPVSLASTSFSLPSTSSYTCSMPQMPKHSLAKVTTISPPLTAVHMTSHTTSSSSAASSSSMPLTKPHNPSNFVHKIRNDSGKIVKHSLEKFNTAVRLKSSDLHDMKPIIKTVDKSYILPKPTTAVNINTINNAAAPSTSYQTLSMYNAATGQQLTTTTTALSAASPTSSTSSTSSTKFSDNSSDSGFDENMLDRKSASPLQEDCEKKLLSRPGVQTMFLASGVQIQGQPQNLILTGNDVAAKILQNRKYSTIATTSMASNARTLSTNHPTTTAVKIAQISTGGGIGGHHHTSSASIMSSAAQAKMRAIYNNSNTIQHENGITTIVPASSLAATTQMAAMQNIAPSTVTITPAPLPAGGGGVGVGTTNQFGTHNIISRKLAAANIINLQSNNLSNTTNLNGNHHHGLIGNHLMNSSAATANQKIILLKTSPHTMATTHHHHHPHHQQQQQHHHHQQQQQHSTVPASKYGQATIAGVGGGNGNMMGR